MGNECANAVADAGADDEAKSQFEHFRPSARINADSQYHSLCKSEVVAFHRNRSTFDQIIAKHQNIHFGA
jgi:hypothetical protein